MIWPDFHTLKVVRQRDSMQCGAACLAMICRHFGQPYSMKWLEKYCHVGPDGASMKGIADAATSLGLKCVGSKLTASQLSSAPLPAILHWNNNHFVVIHKITKHGDKFHIADPRQGRVTYTKEEFQKHWCGNGNEQASGIGLFFEPTADFGSIKEPDLKSHSRMATIREELTAYRKPFIHLLVSLLIVSVLQLAVPFLTRAIVDIGIKNGSLKFIWLILAGECMIILAKTSTDFIRRWIMLHVSARINLSLLRKFFTKLLKLPMSFFDVKLFGDLAQRMGDNSRIQGFITGEILGTLYSIISFLIFSIALLLFSTPIFIVYLICMIVYAGWLTLFLKKRKRLDYDYFDIQSANQSKTYELISSMQEIKLQRCENRRRIEWEEIQADLFALQMRTTRLSQNQEAGALFINEIKNALITVLTAAAVIEGNLTLGGMLAIEYIAGQLNSPVMQLIGLIYSLQDVSISIERLDEIHNAEEEDNEAGLLQQYHGKREITLKNVDFKYDPHDPKKTLDNISFSIPEGKVTAIVGHSGSGKSTLLKLMLGYYKPLAGDILLGDSELGKHNMGWWRSRCGTVMQEGIIFSESIRRNIAVSDETVDEERMLSAAKSANIAGFVATLPLGYDTKVGRDGVGLSQGQKQRLLIARAIYRNPDFIFLDEATNSLDACNEKEITLNLNEFYRDKTVVVVAHRLSTVRNADQIVVLSNGRIAESGTHSELLLRRGEYYSLVKSQME